MTGDARAEAGAREARGILAVHAKSFALASRLLGRAERDDAAVVYAWCRRADDAVDLAPPERHAAALAMLNAELDAIAAAGDDGATLADPLLVALHRVMCRRSIPLHYLRELLAGLRMDVSGASYATLADLELYCFRVAGTVGLIMCHVLGVSEGAALRRAAHLGMAMQLTNICRDVAEDARRGRVYLPLSLLCRTPGAGAVARAVETLLAEADRLYGSGDLGLPALSFRSSIAVRAARLVYAAIGQEIAARHFDVRGRRAVVPAWRKGVLVARAVLAGLAELPLRLARRAVTRVPSAVVRYPDDVASL